MPNPSFYHTISAEAAAATREQLEPIQAYLARFEARLRALNVKPDDPLLLAAQTAKRSIEQLTFEVLGAARKPKRSKWE